jgi:hypothetical protein
MDRKLSLRLDALEVQSFATDAYGALPFGTVHGRQRGNTGLQDTDCSAVDACPSARGCSEIAECRPTEGTNCPSAALNCETSRGCTNVGDCKTQVCNTNHPERCPSAVDACPSQRGCTEVGC